MTDLKDSRAGGAAAGWNVFPVTGAMTVTAATGNRITLASGESRTDYVMGWGSLLLGHDPAPVAAKVAATVTGGAFAFQYENPEGVRLASRLASLYPAAEAVRFTNSGLEATMYATRIARAATGRPKVLKFEGHFHGLNEGLLYNIDDSQAPGSARADQALELMPGSGGLPESPSDLLVIPFNDTAALDAVFAAYGSEIAAVICEPIAMNIGCVAPDQGFLARLRERCDQNASLLIFDEILTGFRVALGGAAELFGIQPDLACFGKAFGCGAPLGAVGGSAAVMGAVEPPGTVAISGTNTGRRLTMAWANASLDELEQPGTYDRLAALNAYFVEALTRTFEDAGVPAYVEGYGGRVGVHIGSDVRPRTMAQVYESWDQDLHYAIYRHLATHSSLYGFLLPLRLCPEPVTLSLVHTEDDIDAAMDELRRAVNEVR